MENYMPMTMTWSKSKLEVESQYGGRLFSGTHSSIEISGQKFGR